MKKIIITFTILIITLTLSSCNLNSNPNTDYCITGNNDGVYICEKTETSYFDTTISLKLYYNKYDDYDILEVFNYFEKTLETYHEFFDKYHDYDGINNIYKINNSSESIILNDKLYEALDFVLKNENIVEIDNQPLFNIALDPVLKIWHDARESDMCDNSRELGISYCPVPNDLIDGVTFNTNPNDIILDNETKTITFLKPNMSIDLGGFGKGYVSKIISKHLDDLNIEYLLNTGNSNIIAGGLNPNNDDGKYYIALTKPSTDFQLSKEYFIYLKIPEKTALVTSGNYQRFFKGIDDSKVYHHIIDPFTNYPGGYSMSVTVVYPDSALADILSTALYLMPLDDALNFVNSYDNLEAVWYLYDGSIQYSNGFEKYIYNQK